MKRYIDLIKQTFDFSSGEFTVTDGQLSFYGVPLMDIIDTYGTPLRLTYLPKISENIALITGCFQEVMKKYNRNTTLPIPTAIVQNHPILAL